MKEDVVLIVEDEHALSLALAAAVRRVNASSDICATAAIARRKLQAKGAAYRAMILDLGLPDERGLDFLASLAANERPPTLVVTAHGEIENTIAARKLGVVEFLTKPLQFDALNATLNRLLAPGNCAPAAIPELSATRFQGRSAAIQPVFQQIAQACHTNVPVLIMGEPGTGRSLVAQLIAEHGSDPLRSFEDANDELKDLLNRLGAPCLSAFGGTLLLENIEMLDLETQAELLRVWDRFAKVCRRVVVTTTPGLARKLAEGTFLPELFYRCRVLEINLPPLRERGDDGGILTSHFLRELSPDGMLKLTAEAEERLRQHSWPGNLRELRNVLESMAIQAAGSPLLGFDHLPEYIQRVTKGAPSGLAAVKLDELMNHWLEQRLITLNPEETPAYDDLRADLERSLVKALLGRCEGKLARVASLFRANRNTLRRKL